MTLSIDINESKNIPAQEGCSLSLFHCLSYCAPATSIFWIYAPIAILQGIYAKYYGFPLTTIAAIVLVARLFDAITDPLIGYFSDRHYRRTGTRKPFVLAGGLLLMISSYFLYIPFGVDTASIMSGNNLDGPAVSVTYFTAWILLFYFAYTLFEIPHYAWGSELASSSVDKSKIYSFRGVAAYLGLILFYSIPLMPFFESKEITPATLKISVIAANFLLVCFLYFTMRVTPSRLSRRSPKEIPEPSDEVVIQRRGLFQSIAGNTPLILFFSAFLFSGIANGLWYGLIFLYVDSFLNMGEQFSLIFLLGFLISVVLTPLYYKLSMMFGKRGIVAIGMLLITCSYLYLGLLVPGETSVPQLFLLIVSNAVGFGCLIAFTPAMLSEIIDFSTWKYRSQNTAMYFSLYSFIGKANTALGAALGLAIIGWAGYDATATTQTTEAIASLMLSMVWLPGTFTAIALVLIALNPINTRRHHIVRRRMDELPPRTS